MSELDALSKSLLILLVFARMSPIAACKALSVQVILSMRYSTLCSMPGTAH